VALHTLYYIESAGGAGNMRPRLLGFTEEMDRAFFELLTTVGNLGSKTALRALTIPVGEIAAAIESGDAKTLAKLPRIGAGRKPEEEPFVLEAKEVLLQVGYRASDADAIIAKILDARPDIASAEELVQEVFRARAAK